MPERPIVHRSRAPLLSEEALGFHVYDSVLTEGELGIPQELRREVCRLDRSDRAHNLGIFVASHDRDLSSTDVADTLRTLLGIDWGQRPDYERAYAIDFAGNFAQKLGLTIVDVDAVSQTGDRSG